LAAGGDGFAICDVRRREDELRDWLDTVLLPAVSAVGRTAQPTTVPPVWSFARP